jgi:hypothetical protein
VFFFQRFTVLPPPDLPHDGVPIPVTARGCSGMGISDLCSHKTLQKIREVLMQNHPLKSNFQLHDGSLAEDVYVTRYALEVSFSSPIVSLFPVVQSSK